MRTINDKKVLCVYHKDCMDGISSAYIVDERLGKYNNITFLAMQYGEDFFNEFEKTEDNIKTFDEVIVVDFCLQIEEYKILESFVDHITILDHHKTAIKVVEELQENKIYTIVFDMNISGALVTFDYFNMQEFGYNRLPFEYISDRDIWAWKLKNSKEVSEAAMVTVEPNNLISFNDFYCNWNLFSLVKTGSILLAKTDQVVSSKIKLSKLTQTSIRGIDVLMTNATNNISEIGNGICLEHGKISCMYFILPDGKVIFSLRSIDTLKDASEIAKSYGGGGHRNACGFEGNLKLLQEFLGI